MDAIGEYLLGLGDTYIRSFVSYCADKLKDEFLDIVGNYKEIPKKVKEVKEKIVSVLHNRANSKYNYKDDSVFKDFNSNEVKKIINQILEKEQIYAQINTKIKNDFENFKFENNEDTLNILLYGEDEDDINTFSELISKVFNSNNDNIMNIYFKKYFASIKKLNIIKGEQTTINTNISCIWYIIDEQKKKIEVNDVYKNLPIIYIGLKGKVDPENIYNLEKADKRQEKNLDLLDNYLIDIDIIKEEICKSKKGTNEIDLNEYFMRLIEKSILNIIFNNFRIIIENKEKEILDIVLPRINFMFGNEIKNFYNLNKQIMPIIFQKFLNLKKLPNYIQQKYRQILLDYQKYLEDKEKSYFSEFLLKNSNQFNKKSKDKSKDDIILNKMFEKMVSYISEKLYENEEDKKTEAKKDEKKEKKVKKQKIPVNKVCEDDINLKIKIMFEDYFINKSSQFINELISKTLKDLEINYYFNEISEYYFGKYKNEEVIIYNNKK